jgi:DNA-binding MurR/RpiR family transcriptional regulator
VHEAGRPAAPQRLCFLQLHPAQEDIMSEIVMTTEAEVEDFNDDLSDEALDRAVAFICACNP